MSAQPRRLGGLAIGAVSARRGSAMASKEEVPENLETSPDRPASGAVQSPR